VVMQFRLASAGTDEYARILNPTLPADDSDNGLYLYNSYLVWYDDDDISGTEGAVPPEKYVEIAFTRNTAGKIRTYVNGEPDINYTEADAQAVIQNHLLRFFVDNSNDETSKGAVSRIRLYNDALTAKKVKRIYKQGH
jgi:Concanavalin A-like lectin/glucanases superfamily